MKDERRGSGRLILAGLILALVGAACAPGERTQQNGSGDGGSDSLAGSIAISGSSTVEPISAAVAQKFSAMHPDVQISVEGPGTGDGFELFCNDEIDIADASRPIDPDEEVPLCEKNGVEFIELNIGIDGITVVTSAENNEVECLSFRDLYALLGPESEGFDQWSDANQLAQKVGAEHAPYPQAPLEITAPGEESGTYDSFAELVLEDIAYEDRGIEEDAPVVRPDYQASADDNVIIQGIQGSGSSLGWVGFSFFEQNTNSVRAIPVMGEDGQCVEPTTETIQSGEYPISRDLYIYVNADKAESNPALASYVDYYLSAEGLATVPEVGYVQQAESVLSESMDAWENRATGSGAG